MAVNVYFIPIGAGGTTSKIANNLMFRLLAIFHLVTIEASHYKSHYTMCF